MYSHARLRLCMTECVLACMGSCLYAQRQQLATTWVILWTGRNIWCVMSYAIADCRGFAFHVYMYCVWIVREEKYTLFIYYDVSAIISVGYVSQQEQQCVLCHLIMKLL